MQTVTKLGPNNSSARAGGGISGDNLTDSDHGPENCDVAGVDELSF